MITVFVSHGSPMLALQPGRTGAAWQALERHLPKPKVILCVSAHWQAPALQLTAAIQHEILYDFTGFPDALYALRYPAIGAPTFARRVMTLLQEAGCEVSMHPTRGLDHGAWMPLKLWYPHANIPVIQLSLLRHAGPAQHYAIGQALLALQDEDVLLLASGAVTHNLYDFFSSAVDAPVMPYVPQFADWLASRIAGHDIDRLLNYRACAPHAQRAHPSEEHILPLFVALGAARGTARRIEPETCYGILAMDAYVWEGED